MKSKTSVGIMLPLILIGILSLAFNIQQVKAEPRTWTVDDDGPANFHTIQEAIDAASPDDTIYVRSGLYYENVVVNKNNLSLFGENKDTTIIDGKKMGDGVTVGAENILISRFTVRNSSGFGGIALYSNSRNCTINENLILNNNRTGIFHLGFNHRIIGNTITNNYLGIELSGNNSLVSNNVVCFNSFGFEISSSFNHTLRGNKMNSNIEGNFGVWGFEVLGSSEHADLIHDIDTSNTVSGKPIYYLINQKNLIIDPSSFPYVGYLGLVNSTNITVKDLSIRENGQGVLLAYTNHSFIENVNASYNLAGIHLIRSRDNTIYHNTASNNDYGICLSRSECNISQNSLESNSHGILFKGSNGSVITENRIVSNSESGIWLYDSYNNKFSHNNFIENSQQVYSGFVSHDNVWDNGYPSSGNYWSDYADVDLYCGPQQNIRGSDGIYDHPYVIDENNTDNYPLVKPFVLGNLAVSTYTDKYVYHAGETMHLGLNVTNPDSVKYVCFALWLEFPDGSTHPYMHKHSVILPIGLNYANPSFQSIKLPTIPQGKYTWHAAFLERSIHTIIVEDTAEWWYQPI